MPERAPERTKWAILRVLWRASIPRLRGGASARTSAKPGLAGQLCAARCADAHHEHGIRTSIPTAPQPGYAAYPPGMGGAPPPAYPMPSMPQGYASPYQPPQPGGYVPYPPPAIPTGRPIGVTLIALFNTLGTGAALVLAVWAGSEGYLELLLACLFVAALNLPVAIGLWVMKKWGLIIATIVYVMAALLGLSTICGSIIGIVILFYLWYPSVRRRFT
jgi:hypothetical protein